MSKTILEDYQENNPMIDVFVIAADTCPSDCGYEDIENCWLRDLSDSDEEIYFKTDAIEKKHLDCLKCWMQKKE